MYILALLAVVLVGASSQDIRAPPSMIYPTAATKVYNSSGSNVVVKCKAGGVPQPTYKWMRNGAVVIPTSKITYNPTTGDLTIFNLTTQEEGTYICIATNSFDNGLGGRVEASSWSAPVKIYQSRIDPFNGKSSKVSIEQFEYLKIGCYSGKVVGDAILYNWYNAERRKIDLNGDRLFIDQTGNLHFAYVLTNDSLLDGYNCGISFAGEDDIVIVSKYKLTVIPRTITEAMQPQSHDININVKGILYSSVKLECFFSGYDLASASAPAIQWFDAGQLITPSSKYTFTSYGRVLMISNLTEDDEKQYTCETRENSDGISTGVFLNVTSGPIWMPKAPTDQTVLENTNVQFSCAARSASGETPPSAPVWRINGVIMGPQTDPNKFSLSANGNVLNIKNVKKSTDIMCVQCQVSNDIGTAFANACLNVVYDFLRCRDVTAFP